MKLGKQKKKRTRAQVASRAEAWVETLPASESCRVLKVASRAEAWVETVILSVLYVPARKSPPARRRGLKRETANQSVMRTRSPPARRRGLKHLRVKRYLRADVVASRAEAWVETVILSVLYVPARKSPPARRRGLKRETANQSVMRTRSPPARRRGLKLQPRISHVVRAARRLPRGGVG